MRKKNRNNALRMKRSLQKTLQKTGEALKATEKRRLEAQKLKEEQRQNELKRKQLEIVIPKTVIFDDIVIPKIVIPEKAVVSSSALIPLGILAFLLINSRNNKK